MGVLWGVPSKIVTENDYVFRVRSDAMESRGRRNISEGGVIVEGNQSYLKSFNSQYPLIPFEKDAKIIGVAKQAVMRFC